MVKREDLSLYDEVSARGFEASVVASYNIDFAFYERVILRRLQSVGCRHNIVLADASQCGKELAIDTTAPHFAGAEYSLLPVRAGGAFHPKFILLIGRKKARVIVGSHNTSVPGFGLSREVTSAFDIEPEGSTIAAGRAVWDFVLAWTAELPPDIQKVVAATNRIAPWLTSGVAASTEHPLLMYVPGGKSLWDQLKSRLKSKVEKVFVVSPYFDMTCSFLQTIGKELNPKELIVALQPQHALITKKARSLVPLARFVDISAFGENWADKRLHAKLFKFEFQNGESLVVTGSANASAPAWLSIASERNAELVVVHENGNQVWKDLGLEKLGKLEVLSEADWKSIGDRVVIEPPEQAISGQAPSLAVAASEGFVVSAEFAKGLAADEIEFVSGATPVGRAEFLRTVAGGVLVLCSDAKVLATATLLRGLTKRGSARVAVIHRVGALLDRAAGTTHQAFRRALSGLEGDPEHLSQLIQIVEKAIFDTAVTIQDFNEASAKTGGGARTEPEAPEYETLMVSAKDTIKGRRRRRVSATTDLALIIDALIYKLGQGLQHEDTDSQSSTKPVEQGADDDNDDPDEPDGRVLAKLCRGKINRLFKRMIQQMEAAVERNGGATTVIIQLAAVLGVVKHLRLAERSLDWLPRGEALVDWDPAWHFFKDSSRLLHAPKCDLASLAIAESGGQEFDELTICRALLAWVALECQMDTRTAISSAEDADEARDNVEAIGYFLPVIVACSKDDQAGDMLRTVARAQGGHEENVGYHLRWAGGIEKASHSLRSPATDLKPGSIAVPLKVASARPAVVVEVLHDKAGILDLDTGELKFFTSGYLSKIY